MRRFCVASLRLEYVKESFWDQVSFREPELTFH